MPVLSLRLHLYVNVRGRNRHHIHIQRHICTRATRHVGRALYNAGADADTSPARAQAASSSLLHRMLVPLGFRTLDGGLEVEAPERAARRMIRAELNLVAHRRRQVRPHSSLPLLPPVGLYSRPPYGWPICSPRPAGAVRSGRIVLLTSKVHPLIGHSLHL
jgi:hypothetical protein